MFTLHTGLFARLLTALALVGLLLGGASVSVMAMPSGDTAAQLVSADDALAADTALPGGSCEHTEKAHNNCADNTDAYQCDTGVDCCPHAGSALPGQLDVVSEKLADVQTSAPQWRLSSVTPVTEIRPPISTL